MGRYSDTLMDHFASPRNCGPMEDPDRVGLAGSPGRGPYVLIHLRLDGDRIAGARFQCDGCGPTIASASALTEMVAGRRLADCAAIEVDDLVAALDGVPPEKLHSPTLAVAALRHALGPA